MNKVERTTWLFLGITVAVIGGIILRAHRELIVVLSVGSRIVERCRRCKREYTYVHPSQVNVARKYHDEFDCVAHEGEDDEQDCA